MEKYLCLICGQEMEKTEKKENCVFCGKREKADYLCPDGHYICEECRLADVCELIERVCRNTKETDPLRLVNLIMHHPAIPMHSAHHHYLITPIVLTVLANLGQYRLKAGRIKSAIKRTADIPYAVCGSRGDCGAAVAIGALVSILTEANYLKNKERSLTLWATAKALKAIGDAGGARCCKQSIYLSLETAIKFLRERLHYKISFPRIKCEFSSKNGECKKERCKYYDEMVADPG